MNIDKKRKREKTKTVIRWVLYFFLLSVEYVVMTTVQANIPLPLLMLSTAVCISVFEDPFDSALTGCVAGLMLDSAEGTLMGINGIMLMFGCLISSLLFYFVMRKHIVNVLLLSAAAAFIQTGFWYIFSYLIWGYDSNGRIYLHEFVPIMITTVIASGLLYPLIRFMHNNLGEIRETYVEEKSDDIVRE